MINTNEIIDIVTNIAQIDGDFSTGIPGLMIYRRSHATEPMPCIYGLGLGITIQGGKRVILGDEVFDYGPRQSIVTALDLPVVALVTHASKSEPYLGVRLELDNRMITQLAADMDFEPLPKDANARALSVVDLDQAILDAIARLIGVINEPQLLALIAPLIQREIVVRLLAGHHGPTLRQLVTEGLSSQQIAKVMTWLKHHFINDVSMDELALKAHMSPSTFRLHFRAVTGMSPLQYVKQLRLQNARQLMLNEELDASSAAIRVGYESASQFSREYSRLFGEPPQRDIKRIKVVAPE